MKSQLQETATALTIVFLWQLSEILSFHNDLDFCQLRIKIPSEINLEKHLV